MGANIPSHVRIVGDSSLVELAASRNWNLTDGIRTFKRWHGRADAITEKFNALTAAGTTAVFDEINEDIEGKTGRLIARINEDSGGSAGGNTEELNAVWELYAMELRKPIEAHTDFRATLISASRKREIESFVRDAKNNPEGLPVTAAEKSLYGYYANQVLDFLLTELELRKTTTLSSRSAITASYVGMNRVVTLASINPPSALIGVLTSLPLMNGSTGSWEWLMLCPQLRQISKRTFQLAYAWRGAEEWAEIYGGSWTPTYP